MSRRSFLKAIAGCSLAPFSRTAASVFPNVLTSAVYIGLHPFIEAHPEAVFIRRTHLQSREDAEGKKREALLLAQRILTLRNNPGIPLTHKFSIKPNLTSAKRTGLAHAIVTDPYVTEGFVEGLKGAGVQAERIFVREGLMVEQPGVGFTEMSRRTGVHYGDDESRAPVTGECTNGVVFRRTRYLGPFNYPDSWLINIAKFKTHSMGLTLCVKNLQGTNIPPYIRFCGGIQPAIAQDFQPDAELHVDDLYTKHRDAGMPRWETSRGPWMEMWVQRTIDSYSLLKAGIGLNLIEGIYGQNGDGFDGGPAADGTPDIFLTNLLVFGRDAFRVDIVGHWLGGHEPGNFGLFHIAKERGVSNALNPRNIPVYEWEDAGPVLKPLESFTRTPMTTPYLEKPGEARFHLCDEPFSYPGEQAAADLSGGPSPDLRVLGQQRTGERQPVLALEYRMPVSDRFLLEVYDSFGERIAVPASGYARRGVHMAAWCTGQTPPGLYYCRLKTSVSVQIRSLVLVS